MPAGRGSAGVAGEDEGQRVAAVARRRQHADLYSGSDDHIAFGEPFVAEPVGDVQGTDRSRRAAVERSGARGMVNMTMGKQDHLNWSRRDDRVEMPMIRRAGVDDHTAGGTGGAQQPRVRAVQCHRAGIGREQHCRECRHLPGYGRTGRHRGHCPPVPVSRLSHSRCRAGTQAGPCHRATRFLA